MKPWHSFRCIEVWICAFLSPNESLHPLGTRHSFSALLLEWGILSPPLHYNYDVSSSEKVWILGQPRVGGLPGKFHGEANAKRAAVCSLCQLEWGCYLSSQQQQSTHGSVFSPSSVASSRLSLVLGAQLASPMSYRSAHSHRLCTGCCHK